MKLSDNLFKKALFFTDIHFGRNGNNPAALIDNIEFVQWAIEEARTRGCETMIFGGDWHDNRHSVHVSTLHASLQGLQMLNDAFEKVWFIPGNHDLFFRDRRDISSIEFVKNLPNIKLIRNPTTMGNVTFLPWLVGDEHKKLKFSKSRYCFAHLEVPGFLMNAKVEMPDSPHAIQADAFASQDLVFTGHFHMRQTKGNIVYTGNVMPFNFSDNWDSERGAMILEWGHDPEFIAWPGQPLFRTMRLSEMLNSPQTYLARNLTARVTLDTEISYEEAQFLRDSFVDMYKLRKVELVHQQKQEVGQEYTGDVTFQSVDEIVVDGLLSVSSTGFRPEMLVDIYKSLPSA
ncbi:MAG: hypothetical protein EOP84_23015 [Verrucomicrobiaceae bacterium]|nr:MAG: hypothetical protein EOP84_23015 [Verrucomicrobiaceae bacterium]